MCILPGKEERGDAAVTPNISATTIVYVYSLRLRSARDPKGFYYQQSDG